MLVEFLALSGVLFTISENVVAIYYVIMAPFWILREIMNKTLTAAIFGAIITAILFYASADFATWAKSLDYDAISVDAMAYY
jgi:hypothetical protein